MNWVLKILTKLMLELISDSLYMLTSIYRKKYTARTTH